MKKSVLLRAPLLTLSGYGIHSRQVFKWLETRNDIFDISVEILNWGMTTWIIDREYDDGVIGRIMDKSGKPGKKYDMTFQVQLPDEWDTSLGNINIGISAIVETDRCNDKWIEKINQMDAVIVPSYHCKKTIMRSGVVNTKVFVIPEWYNENITEESEYQDMNIDISTNFNFLSVGVMTANNPVDDRKNLFNTIKWFCETFKDDKDVGLILKTNYGKSTKIDYHITKDILRKLLGEVRQGEYPKIHMIHGMMKQSEMANLYKHPSVKCFISLTRGEGYGLPIIESAASGIPIIATNWSGHLDFLNEGKFIPIDYTMKEISNTRVDNRIFLEGFKWADPDEIDFKRKIRKFREKSTIPKEWANDMSKNIISKYSMTAIIKKYNKFLEIFTK